MRESDRYATKNRHWRLLLLAYSRCRSTNKWVTLICKIVVVIVLLIVLFVLTGCFIGASSYAVYNISGIERNTTVDIVKTLEWTLLLVIIECLVIGVMVLLVILLTRDTDQYEYVEQIEIDEFPPVPNPESDYIDEGSL